ncbi:MAG: CCA tRNA nucleotidyltransferase [Candidatus Syntropharchaeia archaeon]
MLEKVLERIKPKEEEKKKILEVASSIVDILNETARKLGIDVEGELVGSVARGTWISGENDIDIFMKFPPSLSREKLEELGLFLAKETVSCLNCEKIEEQYADHPYIRAYVVDGEKKYKIDLVPCFDVYDPSKIKSPVDRTPFHNRYVLERISGMEDEVLLLKQFMRGIQVYGSELKTQGFSGYLCELLILRYSSFIEVLESAGNWKYGERIDLERHGRYEGENPLIIIDPVDPYRNAAAAVSIDSFSRFIDSARNFLDSPDERYFFPPPTIPIGKAEFIKKIEERGMDVVAIFFDSPEVVEDVLYPQLRKAEVSIKNLIEKNDFRVFQSGIWSDGKKCAIVFEMEVSHLPKIKRHIGPPVTSRYHAKRFKEKHGVYLIQNGRYVTHISRKYIHVSDLLKNEMTSCGLGKHVGKSIERGYEVFENEEIPIFRGFDIFMRKLMEK